ncbi:MAG: hypothetical protein IT423_22475 [Pirellulaceae bacterium]|nr:hypothetical protein [Pirellulaceae bacterium]
MLRELQSGLSAVRRRQRTVRAVQWLVTGALLGAIVGVGLETARLTGQPIWPLASWLSILACAMTAGVAGWLAPVSSISAARLVDTHYKLQDRTVTALSFAQRQHPDAMARLQLSDALERLKQVAAREVLPLRLPRWTATSVCLMAIMVGLVCVPRVPETIDLAQAQLQQVVNDQATTLEATMLEDLRELAEKHPEPELKELTEELEQMVAELKSPKIDQREALAKISEMQQSLAAALEKLDLQQVDAQLQEFAAALQPAPSMQALAQMLKAGKYDKAAEELEKFDAEKLDRPARDAVAANLKKFKKELGEGQQGELSQAAEEMQEGLENENQSQCKNGQCKAAGVCKKQGLKKNISQCLASQLNRLSQCKGNCQNPGQCASNGPPKKSQSPSNKAGQSASNQPLGEEKTSLESNRQQEDITGIQGDGPSERETSTAPEGEQSASRSYSERYSEYRRQMEEVLDTEPLPLGHLETVRKYFESIRPTEAESVEVNQ